MTDIIFFYPFIIRFNNEEGQQDNLVSRLYFLNLSVNKTKQKYSLLTKNTPECPLTLETSKTENVMTLKKSSDSGDSFQSHLDLLYN